VRGRVRDAITRQALGDGVEAVPGDELGEDPPHHGGRLGVEGELVHALAVSRLGGVGMRARVGDEVPVGRASSEEPAFHLGLCGHGSADSDLDPVPFAFGQAAEGGHDHVVGLVVGVDGPADLGYPQRDAVMGEQREGVAELVAV
jgi:hypothetical protein